eukprot:TRINITY_DN2068_c0_g1_i1.p1 TRINITY_DN2068_c0_g1~~TRINITY_DN2068_c0_g1_i1.p1  ORF type:complete len:240 (-),score=60.97 TRINITY_DN2068_c0_g1_i1:73-792(-)
MHNLDRLCDKRNELMVDDLVIPPSPDPIHTEAQTIGNHHFDIITLQGQRSKRRTWILALDAKGLAVRTFFVNLCQYNQVLDEDHNSNRMVESIAVFQQLLKHLLKECIILIFTFADEFKEKITKVDLSKTFPKYTGGGDYYKALQFIKNEFFKVIPKFQLEINLKHVYVRVINTLEAHDVKETLLWMPYLRCVHEGIDVDSNFKGYRRPIQRSMEQSRCQCEPDDNLSVFEKIWNKIKH